MWNVLRWCFETWQRAVAVLLLGVGIALAVTSFVKPELVRRGLVFLGGGAQGDKLREAQQLGEPPATSHPATEPVQPPAPAQTQAPATKPAGSP